MALSSSSPGRPTSDFIIEASVGYLDATLDELDIIPLAAVPASPARETCCRSRPNGRRHVGIGYDAHMQAASDHSAGRRVLPGHHVLRCDEHARDRAARHVTTVNASLRSAQKAGNWGVTLGVNNATDETYPVAGNSLTHDGQRLRRIAYSRPTSTSPSSRTTSSAPSVR